MIGSLEIRGLGPHKDTKIALSPDGATIEGKSRAGKSTIMDALCFALWGEDRLGRPYQSEAVREGGDTAVVRLELATGALIHRELRVGEGGGRRHIRIYSGKNGEQSYATEKDWMTNAIGPLGHDRDLLRLVMVGGWESLAMGEGGGRPLRDALLRATARSAVDVRQVVDRLMGESGYPFLDTDSVDPKTVETKRRDARKAADRAVGARDQALLGRQAAACRVVEPPARKAVEDAQLALTLHEAWQRYDAARADYDAAVERSADNAGAVAAWERAVAELGERPTCGSAEELLTLREAQAAAVRERDRAWQARVRANSALDAATARAEQALAALGRAKEAALIAEADLDAPEDVSDQCPTCLRHGWDGAVRAAEAAREEAAEAARAALKLATDATDEGATALERATDDRVTAAEALFAAEAARMRADAAREEAETRHEAVRSWDLARSRLGAAPVPPGVPPAPVAPQMERPADPGAARALLDEAQRCEGEGRRIAEDLLQLDRLIETAEREAVRTEIEALRLDALVDAVRQAPTLALMEQLGALGDLGPVSFDPGESGGIAVLIDGRAWQLASDGERVVADLWFRAGLRRSLRKAWLPIIVDRVQDVGGMELPEVGGQVIYLRTTGGEWRVSTALSEAT